jgi:murein DD-endopeptidase MepM/ murein hydrolase activator NlpD
MTRSSFALRSSFVLAILALFATSLRAQSGQEAPQPTSSARDQADLAITPRRPGLGSLVRLSFRRSSEVEDSVVAVTGWMAGEPLHFRADRPGVEHALGVVPTDASDSVVARAYVRYASGRVDTLRTVLSVPHRAAVTERRVASARRLHVSKVFTARPDSLTEARVARENEEARAIGRHAHETPQLWSQPFIRPRTSRITSGFGSGRVFNGRLSSSHGGVDFAGRPGDPVRAANRGVVALVDNFFLAGNVVYVNHGAGVVTGYFHLTQALVAVGDTVQRGQEIGLVGATGRVTGPHLHWSARYGEHTFDPMGLIELTR